MFLHLADGQTADEMFGENIRFQRTQEFAHFVGERPADGIIVRDLFDDFRARFGADRQRFAQHVEKEIDLDAALAHPRDKLVMLPLRAFHPQYIVEQQIIVIRRRQTLERKLGAMHQHFA
ncbi:MAG: hypothetical protein HDKAJFGB_01180 [Anaerolineae bacterium]|nr:hypothetical protein [Anaerolineae bacterium]